MDLGCETRECFVTVDSGTSHLAMPRWAIQKVQGRMPLRTSPVPCETSEQFGSLTYVIDGKDYVLHNHIWTFDPQISRKLNQDGTV